MVTPTGVVILEGWKLLDPGYILKVEPMGFADKLDEGCEEKRGEELTVRL